MSKAKMNEDSRTMYLARALYDAVEDSNIQQVNSLLSQKKANPNILIPEEMMTPFHLAAGHENLAFGKVVTSLFLHNGGDPNVLCEGNRTVLHIAVAWNRSSVVEILLNSPYIIPNPFIKDEDNLSVFNYAIKFNSWESLAILQSIMKRPNFASNLKNQIHKSVESVYVEKDDSIREQETEKSKCAESTFNISDKLHMSSGYFNSGESLDSSSKSTKQDSTNKLNNECLNLSSVVNSSHDILNENISPDNNNSEQPDHVSTNNNLEETMLSSIKSINDNFEDLENVSFPSSNLDTDSELSEVNENEIANDINSQIKNIQKSYSEWMTDMSGLSSIFTDDFFTCPDTSSEENLSGDSIDTDLLLAEIASCLSMTSFSDSMSKSISKNSARKNNRKVSNCSINSKDDISSSSCSSIAITEDYDTDFLRQSLRSLGQPPGPLVPSTKRLYVHKLSRLLKNQKNINQNDDHVEALSGTYSSQLTKVLTPDDHDTWKITIKSWKTLEESIVGHRSGSSFTYLLLDPRITQNLPARTDQFEDSIEIWQTFIKSIFYIGKGTKSRPNDHMNEAFQSWTSKSKKEKTRKTEYILNIWKEKMGVVCVQAFHHLELKEAHIREAAMIDAIGLDNLTNEKRGTYYDHTIRWRNSDRCKLGCHLLYRAMLVFLADGERQLRPVDLT